MALAKVVHANDGALPDAVIERMQDQIERPTLGTWLGMLEALSANQPDAALVAPGIFALYRDVFAPTFRGEGQGGTLDTSLLILRNHLAHGGGLRTEAARELLEQHEYGVFDLLRIVAQATAGTEVIAVTGGSAQRLTGPEPANIPCPPVLQDTPDGPWLVGDTGTLPLLPLAEFGPVRRIGASGRLEQRPGGPAAQLYLRGDRQRLTYVPIAGDETVAHIIDVEAFRALFRLDTRTASPSRAGEAFHW